MFTYKNIANRSLEIIVKQPFTREEVYRAFSFMDALVEDIDAEISFKVQPELREHLIAMIDDQNTSLYKYSIVENID
ncbi:hypothetical protein [Flavimarina sp. Hel_I_48]|uniref:hypothetical protein n=1 Tax=Flavimarina sp. Hel_I_48 TaxID=1392488 RepID=UPI0004DF901C|nr:hypothetical protein [Flavimarina sp. Hel_I_48]